MDLNFVLELVLFCLCFTELLAVDSTKFLKFSGFQCNETSGPALEGLYDGQCIGKALEDACWAFRVCPDCQCCHTVMEVADSSTFLYSLAHRVIGDPCVSDDHCPFGCVNGICDCDSATILNATKNGCRDRILGDPCVNDSHCPATSECISSVCSCRSWLDSTGTSCTSCPSGFELNAENEKCYLFSTNLRSWTNAENHCVSFGQGVHLASIHSQQEMHYLSNKVGTVNFWVGGSDAAQERIWTWTDGTPFDFVGWGSDQPDGGSASNCMAIPNGRMFDFWCTKTFRFICKADAAY